MRMHSFIQIVPLCLMLLSSAVSWSQTNNSSCKDVLYEANKLYENGQFEDALSRLNNCSPEIEKAFRFEGDRLKALCYLNIGNMEKARLAVRQLLLHKPDYKVYPYVDPRELSNLLAQYEVWPQLEVGLKTGLNVNSVSIIKGYAITQTPSNYLPTLGFQGSVFVEYFVTQKVAVVSGFQYEQLSYRNKATNNGWERMYKENLTYYSLPIGARYYWYAHKLAVGVELGWLGQWLNTGYGNITFQHSSLEGYQNTLETTPNRTTFNQYATVGSVVKYKLGAGSFGFNIQMAYGLNNIVKPETRYNNLSFNSANQYIDSDIKFVPVSLQFSYQWPILYTVKAK
jgi:tetratricopeptide (TPR) repeat protein